MSRKKVLPTKSAEADSTSPLIGQPDHIAPDPKATPSPDDSPNLVLPLRSLLASEGSDFLSPLFTQVASALVFDFNEYLYDDKVENIGLLFPYVLITIIDSDISAQEKLYWLKFFLRFVSIISMVYDYDPSEYADHFGDLLPDGDALTKESIFASLLSELTPYLAVKGSEYVYYPPSWYFCNGFEPGELAVTACIYETLAKYLAQFVKPSNSP